MATTTARSANRDAYLHLYSTSFGGTVAAEIARTLPAPEARWAAWLGARFDAELEAWPRQPFLGEFLAAADSMRFRVFAVLAYDYLHLAYDLPRFLADSFGEFPDVPAENRYRAYVLGAQVIRARMIAESGPSALGALRLVRWMLPGDRPLSVGWILAHRCAAWPAAERLAAATDRAALEQRLWQGIDQAARTWFPHPPWRWMRELPFSSDLVSAAGQGARKSTRFALPF